MLTSSASGLLYLSVVNRGFAGNTARSGSASPHTHHVLARLAMTRSARAVHMLWCAALLYAAAPAHSQNAESPPVVPTPDFATQAAAPVVRIVAGNHIVVQLDGVETPVRLIGNYVAGKGPEADAAAGFLQRLLMGERVWLTVEPDWPERDRDERRWAYVYRAPDGLFVNLELLRAGYARVSAPSAFSQQAAFRAYERCARQQHKGVWAQPEKSPIAEPDEGAAPAASQPARAAPASRPAPQATPATQPTPAGGELVYVTTSGKKYHRSDCQFARGAGAVTLAEAKLRGLTPCSRCKPPP
jgi:endonuclease YncB( thermonuclease family)